ERTGRWQRGNFYSPERLDVAVVVVERKIRKAKRIKIILPNAGCVVHSTGRVVNSRNGVERQCLGTGIGINPSIICSSVVGDAEREAVRDRGGRGGRSILELAGSNIRRGNKGLTGSCCSIQQ